MKPYFPGSFASQQDRFSCGPASLTTVSRLFGLGHDYHFFRELIKPCPEGGSCNDLMVEVAQEYLPYSAHGQGVYSGGVAIANIMHFGKRVSGHYVVFLDKKDMDIVYYDPFDHEIICCSRNKLVWQSGNHPPLVEWSINFKHVPGMAFQDWMNLKSRVN